MFLEANVFVQVMINEIVLGSGRAIPIATLFFLAIDSNFDRARIISCLEGLRSMAASLRARGKPMVDAILTI